MRYAAGKSEVFISDGIISEPMSAFLILIDDSYKGYRNQVYEVLCLEVPRSRSISNKRFCHI